MGDQEKKDGCCNSHGGGCCGGKKFMMGLVAGALIFASGIMFAKTLCPKGGSWCPMDKKMCPITGKPMGEMPAK